MEVKDMIGLTLIGTAILIGASITCLSQKARDAAFFVMTAGGVLTQKLDINFVSRYWYRGSTRGFEVSFIDILAISLLLSGILLPRPGQKRWYWPAGLGVMLLYFGYACFSVSISDPKLFGLFEITKLIRGLIIFLVAAFYVRSARELSILVFALGCSVCLEGALSLKQRYLSGVHRVTGTIDHPNSLSMYLCLVAPVFVAAAASNLHRYLRYFSIVCIGAATVTILLTISRAGIPIFALVTLGATAVCVSWRITLKKIAATLAVALGVTGLVLKSWPTLEARFSQATLEQEYGDEQVEGRGYYLRQARVIIEDSIWGIGLNNWSYWVSKKYGAQLGFFYEDYDDLANPPTKEELPGYMYAAPAHNLGALTAGELGVPGLFVFALIWLRWFQMGFGFLWRRSDEALSRLGAGIFFAVGGVFLQSLFEWVYRQSTIFYTIHILVGALASLCQLKHEAKRRPVSQLATPNVAVAETEAAVALARSG